MTWGNIFLKLRLGRSGNVDGEAAADGYAGQIEIGKLDFGIEIRKEESSFGQVANELASKLGATVARTGRTRSVTRAHLKDIGFTKRFDIASPVLLKALNSQEQISEALFTVLRRGETAARTADKAIVAGVPLLVVKLNFGYVESVGLTTPSRGNGLVVEEVVALRYRDISIDYFAAQSQSKAMNFSHNKG